MAKGSLTHLAPFATPDDGGREYAEPENSLRGPFELDRHRVIESTAFRRLEGKTQVFAAAHHDHFRTRLTHTLEVAQVARCLARALRANEALAEVITLAHDLGHPPFGHAGEAALNEELAALGGFNHNAHSLRVVEHLEHPFPAFRGLNLTRATRNGLRAHVTRYDRPGDAPKDEVSATAVAEGPSVEAQIASVADRIAYDCHDLEDAMGAEFVGLDDLDELPLWQNAFDVAVGRATAPHIFAVRRAVLDTMLDAIMNDIVTASLAKLAAIESPRAAREPMDVLVAPSPSTDALIGELERFLIERVYRHPEIVETDGQGRSIVHALFDAYRRRPDELPKRFAARIEGQGRDRVIGDYIAGMTDRFCRRDHDRLASS